MHSISIFLNPTPLSLNWLKSLKNATSTTSTAALMSGGYVLESSLSTPLSSKNVQKWRTPEKSIKKKNNKPSSPTLKNHPSSNHSKRIPSSWWAPSSPSKISKQYLFPHIGNRRILKRRNPQGRRTNLPINEILPRKTHSQTFGPSSVCMVQAKSWSLLQAGHERTACLCCCVLL